MALGPYFCNLILEFLINNSLLLILTTVLGFVSLELYNKYWRVSSTDYNTDMMERYLWLELTRRYK